MDNWGRPPLEFVGRLNSFYRKVPQTFPHQLVPPSATLASEQFVSRLSIRKVYRYRHTNSREKVTLSHTEKAKFTGQLPILLAQACRFGDQYSTTRAMSLLPTFTIPGWTQVTIAVVAILSQLKSLYDPPLL